MTKQAAKNLKGQKAPQHSEWYTQAMEHLVHVVQELSHARDMDSVTKIVREAARSLTGADGAAFVLRDGDQCYYADENAIAPLWKGRRFPLTACISGWAMLNRQSVTIEDIYKDSRVPADAYRPTFVKSLAMVPIRRNAPIGAIGNYWATQRMPTEEEVTILQALADTTSVALENVEMYSQLQQQVHILQEQQLRINDQHEALEVFTRALAHDLKEPVRALQCFSKMLLEGEGSADKRESYLRYIQEASDRMCMLIDTVLQYTQLDDPSQVTRELCAMEGVLHSVTENLTQVIEEHGATINSSALPEIRANPVHMIQVLQNLIMNALSHNAGKKITVQIGAEEAAGKWLFSVRDNGSGIKQSNAEKIFLPFKRLVNREECMGLGLAICRKIITSYNGTIWCTSAPGQGATFFFTLPSL